METAHHMLVYGCTKPGSAKPIWDCGEMAQAVDMHDTAPPCSEGSQVTEINIKHSVYFINIMNTR